MKIKTSLIVLLGSCLAACDNTTDAIGIYTDSDNINASAAVFDAASQSLAVDSVLSNSNSSYFGRMVDPETQMLVKAEFLAQFNTLEDYRFPDYDLLVKNEQGEIEADSIEIRLYYEKYYGDNDNPMKLDVYELDTTNIIREDTTFYSNADFAKYINKRATGPLARKVFTVKDLTLSDDVLDNSSYTPNIRIMLPKEYGTFIMKKYYENPDFFKNSYNFIRHVCPGFYFRLADGNGTMVKMKVGVMNLYFRYKEDGTEDPYVGMSRFAATPEVLQNTNIENDDLETFVENNKQCTFLKTPAGIFTEITLPVDEIYQNHSNDSISQTQITLYRYNNQSESEQAFDIPQTVLMVRKQDMFSFFENKKISDSKTSYITSFSSSYNTYTFSNISNLISYCKKEKSEEAAKAGMTPEEWAQKHKDWNKVVIIPVETSLDNSNNIVSVTNDMSLGSTRLAGGESSTIKVQVIYSSFR